MFDHNIVTNPDSHKDARPDASLGRAIRPALFCGALAFAALALLPRTAMADEGGVSFWLPGAFASLAAVPQQPGWSLANLYYHTSVSGGGDVALERELELRRVPVGLSLSARLNASLGATADLEALIPTYVFAAPVLGGQLAASMMGVYAHQSANITGTLSGTLSAGPFSIPFMRSDSLGDSLTAFGDLYPQASLRWNQGVYNYMIYAMGDIPVGAYDSTRLANIGIGHGAIDGGGGYTYFNPQTGKEFSAVAGFTYNLTNTATNYQNGVDFHLDMAAAQFLSKQLFVGPVGYVYHQLSADRGSAPMLGAVESRVLGAGPQLGYLFPVGNMQGFLNLKAYFEWDNHDRPAGWNSWLTFAISPAAPPAAAPPPSRRPMIYK
jgi:hypothetical protein